MYVCAALALARMYSPQPIMPVLESEFGVTRTQVGLFITAILAPLAVASIAYGYVLEKVSIRKLLAAAFLLLGLSEIAFGLSNSYFWALNIRGFQGLLLPAVLTGITSYISQTSPKEEVAAAIGRYVGVTVLGGFFGRFFCGLFTDYFGWNFFIVLLGACFMAMSGAIFKFSSDVTASFAKPRPADIARVFRVPHNFHVYIMIFGAFFSFQAVLNFIPFEISNLNKEGEFSGIKTSMMYLGFGLGVLISFNLKKIVAFCGDARAAMIAGMVIFTLALQTLRIESFWVIFGAMIVLCVGNFIAHSTANGFINKMAIEHKGIANGLYVSFYYAGGTLGSFAPGVIYSHFGWGAFLSGITAVCALSLFMLWRLR